MLVIADSLNAMISIREEITIATPPDVLWPILSDPAMVASCIPGAALTKSDEGGTYQGTMRVKFGPTVALFRGEARLAYDHFGRRCTIQGRGIDGRGASRANASGTVEATGGDTTLLKVEGNFNVTGPLETFANAGGVHLARAILAEFAENVAKLVAEQAGDATAPHPDPLTAREERAAPRPDNGQPKTAATAELSGRKLLWRALVSWLRQVFFGKREAQ
jgi:carbon monoxide dehydrogenase subunit G